MQAQEHAGPALSPLRPPAAPATALPKVVIKNADYRRGQRLYNHLQQVAIAMMMVAQYSSLPENYSPKDYRSFVSKKAILSALAALAILYTIIFYGDTATEFASLFVLRWAIPQFEPLLRRLFYFCQAWVNSGFNAVGIIEATQESADYLLKATNSIEPNRAKLLEYKDMTRKAKLVRGAKETGRVLATLAITIPPALAAAFMEEEETVFTKSMTVLTSLPAQYFACADTLAYKTPAIWGAILNQIETNLRILQNDLCSDVSEIRIRGNKTVRVLLDLLPNLSKDAKESQVKKAISDALHNGKGLDLLFALLTMHGGKNPHAAADAVEYVIILQEPMSTTGKILSAGLGAACAGGSMGFSHASVKDLNNRYLIVPLFGLSSFSNLRLGWKGGNSVVEFFYDWLVRGQKKIADLGPWFSERRTWLGWSVGNLLSLSSIAIAAGSVTALFSWGTNYLANVVAVNAGFNAVGLSNSTNFAFLAEEGAGLLGTMSWAVNLAFYIKFYLLCKTAVNLYANGGTRTQRNTQFAEQVAKLVKVLKEIPEENAYDLLIFLAAENPDFTKIAIALCEQANLNDADALKSGLMGNNPNSRPSYTRDPTKLKFVWERDYREHAKYFGSQVNFYRDLPDISTIAPAPMTEREVALLRAQVNPRI